MNTVWKFQIPITDAADLQMPRRARIVAANAYLPHRFLNVWAEVDTENALVTRRLCVVGTGNPIPDAAKAYVTTVQDPPFVWHIYDGGEVA